MGPVGATVARPPYTPFADGVRRSGEFRWRLGLRPLDLADWFEFGPDAGAAIAAKPRLMAEHPDTVFAVLDDRVADEATEVADAIVGHLRRFGATDDVALDTGLHPLDAAARLVPDDLVVLVEREGRLVFGGGSVCFPNRWDLRSKLGRSMAEVHAPVARLNEQLAEPIDAFFERLAPERSYWRLGWTVVDTPDWFTPPVPVNHPTVDWHLRVERETLRRFPLTGVVLFTIRTYVTPLAALAADGAAASALAEALQRIPPDVLAYKSLDTVVDDLVAALDVDDLAATSGWGTGGST
jgi:hypothetical protein